MKTIQKFTLLMLLLTLSFAAHAQSISYQWSTGDTTANISPTPLVTTTYYVTVTQYGVAYFDSVTVVVNTPDFVTDNQVACDSFYWAPSDTTFYNSLVFIDTLNNGAGCDSVVTLNLTINNSNTGTDIQSACDTYTWIDGVTYTTSTSTPTFTLTNASGCDSVVTLDLTINNSNTGTDIQTACDTYTWIDGVTYTASTSTPTFTLTNASGCDSVVTLDLTINYSNTGTDIQTACDTYTWIDGVTYTASTSTPTFTLTNASGCDSVVTLDLTINYSNTGTDIQTACDTYTWIDGVTYTTSTSTPTFTMTNASGCDSVVTLDLTINNSNTGTDIQTACDSYTWIDGVTYTTSTSTPTFTLTNASGCDSVVTLDLTINNSNTGTDIQTACDSYTWIDGVTYTASTSTPTFTLTNASGCDSVVTLNLTINTGALTAIDTTTVSQYTWATNGVTYTASGIYFDTLSSVNGCDSLIKLTLTIVQPLTFTTNTSDTVVCAGTTVSIGVTVDSSSNAFIMKVRTTNVGTSNSNQFRMMGAEGQYHIVATHIATGNIETFNNLNGEQTLTFSNGGGDYLVKVFPTGSTPFHRIAFGNAGDKEKLIDILQWGLVNWSSMENAFSGCINLEANVADIPNLSSVVSLQSMLYGCLNLVGPFNLNSWDVSSVVNIRSAFMYSSFNQPLGLWDVSNVTSMLNLFRESPFNQDISNWDVSSVTTMGGVFYATTSFNHDLSNWDVESVTDFQRMFFMASSFSGDLSGWNVSNGQNMDGMFWSATNFNSDISGWNVSSVSSMNYMLFSASSFNQDLSDWCVTNIDSLPFNFSINSALDSANHPVWGACPNLTAQYSNGTVHCNGIPTDVVDIVSPTTGQIWMDRNLGASQAATSTTDSLAYGDLYQWGRFADGHQCRNSDTTYTISTSNQPIHSSFILTSVAPNDWLTPQDTNLWKGVSGINNPCPSGYRLPTKVEFAAELGTWSQSEMATAASDLGLTVGGGRINDTGGFLDVGVFGAYWYSTISTSVTQSSGLGFYNNGSPFPNDNPRAIGRTVRCIKD